MFIDDVYNTELNEQKIYENINIIWGSGKFKRTSSIRGVWETWGRRNIVRRKHGSLKIVHPQQHRRQYG
tara:strand:+ start:103 stop:309 length:207 start_codon:yes stop_codon:yes gene_type:complete